MARQLRIDYPGAWHHVMNRGRRKETIFPNVEDRFDFLRNVAVAHDRYGIEIHAYALMGNHYHLLVRTPEGGLSAAMKHIDGVFAQRFNRRYELDGPLFRDRFRSKLVDSESYLAMVSRYIHRNPLELVGAANLSKYEWSSYPVFLMDPAFRPSWLYPGALEISGIRTAAELRKQTLSSVECEFDPSEFPEIIGDRNFVNAALARVSVDGQTIGHLRAGIARPSPEHVRFEVEQVFDDENDRRLVVVGLCQEMAGMTLSEIARRFGYASAQSAGNATHRFRKRSQDEAWALLVEQTRKRLEGRMVDKRCRRVMNET